MAVTERQVGKMEVAELKMVRWALGVTRKAKIRNEYVGGAAKIAKSQISECKATLVWTREKERRRLCGKRMMEMAVPVRRKR